MADDITNKELVEAHRPELFAHFGHRIGLKLLWQEALRRLEATPDARTSSAVTASPATDTPEWPKETTATEQTVASGTPKDADNASASDTDGPVPVAQDTPVKDMPLTASGRANLRLGRTKDGKGRP